MPHRSGYGASRSKPRTPKQPTRTQGGRVSSQPRKSGIDVPKFASEVSQNYARGVAQAGNEIANALNRLPGIGASRRASGNVTSALRDAPAVRRALKRK